MAEMPELADCDKEMLIKGITAEMEHFDTVGGDINVVARIACDHLKEFPGKDYYGALDAMEHELQETPEEEAAEHAEGGEEGPAAEEVPAGEERTETPQSESPFEAKKVNETKKEEKEKAEAEAKDKADAKAEMKSILRKIHKATTADELETVLDRLSKSSIKHDLADGKVALLKDEAKRKKEKIEAGNKEETPESETAEVFEAIMAEKKYCKEPKDDEQSAQKKEANKKAEDAINKKAAEKK
jgi:hypothetical protein